MRPVSLNVDNVRDALREIERASHEGDMTEIAQNFTVSGTLSKTTSLNLSSPTLANVAAVLATLLVAMQSAGPNRTT